MEIDICAISEIVSVSPHIEKIVGTYPSMLISFRSPPKYRA